MLCVSIEAARLRSFCRHFKRSLKFSLVFALFGSLPALAQDASTTSPPTALPPVVVTAPGTPAARPTPSPAADTGVTVISPTTISTPVDQVPNSISVITSEQLQRDQRQTVPAGCASGRARPQHRASRRTRRPNVRFHARHQFQSGEGSGRRHQHERSKHPERCLRFRPPSDRRYSAD